MRPRFAGATEVRVEAILAFREFLAAYRDARMRWLAGGKTLFPPGTYWLARFAPAPVSAAVSAAPLPTA